MDIDGRINTDKLENKISSIYENLIYYYNLSINRRKSNFNKTENIFSDLKSFSILEDYDEISSVPTEYKNHLFDFLSDLVKFSEKGSVNYKKYTELVNEYFDDPNSTYHASQILYILIYKNIEWLKETRIIKKLAKIIDNDFNIISVEPRAFVSMIVNTHEEELIKKFLFKLYCCSEEKKWKIFHNFMALQYLLYRNFSLSKLLNKMKPYSIEIVEFISKYYKNDWKKI